MEKIKYSLVNLSNIHIIFLSIVSSFIVNFILNVDFALTVIIYILFIDIDYINLTITINLK